MDENIALMKRSRDRDYQDATKISRHQKKIESAEKQIDLVRRVLMSDEFESLATASDDLKSTSVDGVVSELSCKKTTTRS